MRTNKESTVAIEDVLEAVTYEYDCCLRSANYYFNRYIDYGNEGDKEHEFKAISGAIALKRVLKQIESLKGIVE